MKIICIGRNYADHAKELNNDVPTEPMFFLKPDSALITNNRPFFHPDFSQDIHFECELVIKINKIGKHIHPEFAHKYYKEVTLGVDFTARDLQQQCKQKGLPWEKAKAFDGSAPIGEFVSLKSLNKSVQQLEFKLLQNGETKQQGNAQQMIFSVNEIIAHVSQFFTLKIGDLIFTGTPAGVGKVSINDRLEAYLEGKKLLDFNIK